MENCKRTSLPAKMRVAPPRCAASFTELIPFVQGPVTLFEVQYWRQSTSYPPPTVTSYRYALEPSTSLIPLSSEVAVPSMGGRMQCALRLDVAKAAVVNRSSVSTSNPIERKFFCSSVYLLKATASGITKLNRNAYCKTKVGLRVDLLYY